MDDIPMFSITETSCLMTNNHNQLKIYLILVKALCKYKALLKKQRRNKFTSTPPPQTKMQIVASKH